MNTTLLSPNIIIEGFDTEPIMWDLPTHINIDNIIWHGKTNQIPNDVAEKYVKKENKMWLSVESLPIEFIMYGNYHPGLMKDYNTHCWCKTPLESIQSACENKYCIIYKLKNPKL